MVILCPVERLSANGVVRLLTAPLLNGALAVAPCRRRCRLLPDRFMLLFCVLMGLYADAALPDVLRRIIALRAAVAGEATAGRCARRATGSARGQSSPDSGRSAARWRQRRRPARSSSTGGSWPSTGPPSRCRTRRPTCARSGGGARRAAAAPGRRCSWSCWSSAHARHLRRGGLARPGRWAPGGPPPAALGRPGGAAAVGPRLPECGASTARRR